MLNVWICGLCAVRGVARGGCATWTSQPVAIVDNTFVFACGGASGPTAAGRTAGPGRMGGRATRTPSGTQSTNTREHSVPILL